MRLESIRTIDIPEEFQSAVNAMHLRRLVEIIRNHRTGSSRGEWIVLRFLNKRGEAREFELATPVHPSPAFEAAIQLWAVSPSIS
jgi:hypothetical protein